jgi:hypothetical protein
MPAILCGVRARPKAVREITERVNVGPLAESGLSRESPHDADPFSVSAVGCRSAGNRPTAPPTSLRVVTSAFTNALGRMSASAARTSTRSATKFFVKISRCSVEASIRKPPRW